MPDVTVHVAGKISKQAAEYESEAKGDDHCGLCAYFRSDHCTRVKGTIKAEAWCRLFKAK